MTGQTSLFDSAYGSAQQCALCGDLKGIGSQPYKVTVGDLPNEYLWICDKCQSRLKDPNRDIIDVLKFRAITCCRKAGDEAGRMKWIKWSAREAARNKAAIGANKPK